MGPDSYPGVSSKYANMIGVEWDGDERTGELYAIFAGNGMVGGLNYKRDMRWLFLDRMTSTLLGVDGVVRLLREHGFDAEPW